MVKEITGWEHDIEASVEEFNDWYLRFTEDSYKKAKSEAREVVEKTLFITNNLRTLDVQTLWRNPNIIRGLRMTSSPPWAVDRLIGISGTTPSLVENMENNRTGRMTTSTAKPLVQKIITTITKKYDLELLPWLGDRKNPNPTEIELALAKQVMIDRLALSIANPALKNAQEARQLKRLETWLKPKGYQRDDDNETPYDKMRPGKYRIHVNAEGIDPDGGSVKVSVDIVIKPKSSRPGALPILMECKSAGDFTNVNKRRKEEADKHSNLVRKHGRDVPYVLYLSGYFNNPYLKYEKAAGIKWIWHHRIDDLEELGL